jgi:Fe-S cluster assembly protein SufD
MNIQTLELKSEVVNFEITEDTEVNALFLGRNNDSVQTKFNVIHKKPGLTSRINIKAVVFDNARFDLEGILRIEKGATATDTYLKIDCLVMSDTAFARAVPSLEILGSEVKGGHGATIGYIDPEQIYYMKSHGLTQEESEKMIVEAFIG